MSRMLGVILAFGLIGATATDRALAQQRTPRGYLFFSARKRPSPTASARFTDAPADNQKTSAAAQAAVKSGSVKTASKVEYGPQPLATEVDSSQITPVTWGTIYGMGYGYPESGYYPAHPGYGFGRPVAWPLHGYRSPYDWAGHTYSMHCYCKKEFCPLECPGYRGECYKPCWNDAGTPIFERRCGRGSFLNCFWHQGGWEHPPRCSDCPYDCMPPAYSSYGFPRGTYGDPHYRPPTPAAVPNYYSPDALSMPYSSASRPAAPPQPAGPAIPPEPAPPEDEPPTPKPQA